MERKYFKAQYDNIDLLRADYRKFSFKMHPDKGGEHELFIEMKQEYELIYSKFSIQYKGPEVLNDVDTEKELQNKIDAVIFLDGITIEIVGSWLWITGNTYAHKTKLKEAGFRFSKQKTAWYFHTGKYRRGNGKMTTLEEVKSNYGCSVVSNYTPPQLR